MANHKDFAPMALPPRFFWTTGNGRSKVTSVRILIIPILLIVFLLACKKRHELRPALSNSEIQQQLVGTWECSEDFTNGTSFERSVIVASNGMYVCELSNFDQRNFKRVHIEGTWQIKDGLLIDTMLTNSAATNVHMPIIWREKIIRFDTNQLEVQTEVYSNHFVESVFKKNDGH